QSTGVVSGTISTNRLIVFTTDGTPFTVAAQLAQSASQTTDFLTNVGPVNAGASTQSTTHFSKVVLTLHTAGLPVLQGAGWDLDVGARPDRVLLDFSGAPAVGEVWTLRLVTASGWVTQASRTVQTGDTLTLNAVLNLLKAQIPAATFTGPTA